MKPRPPIFDQPAFRGAFHGAFEGAFSSKDSFDPTGLQGLVLWLDAKKGVTLNGADVSGWEDQSGEGNNAAQLVTMDQPLFSSNGLNGFPGIDFDGSNEDMDIADANSLDIISSFTAYCLCEPGVLLNLSIFSKNANAGYRWFIQNESGAFGTRVVSTNAATTQDDVSSPLGTPTGTQVLMEVHYQLVSPKRVSFTNFGVSLGTDNATNSDIVANNSVLTIGSSTGIGEFFNGLIGQVLIYNRLLNTAERNRVGDFFSKTIWFNMDNYTNSAFIYNWLGSMVGC